MCGVIFLSAGEIAGSCFLNDLSSGWVVAIDRSERGVFMHIHSNMFVTAGGIFLSKNFTMSPKIR